MKKLILFALIASLSLSAYSAPKLTDYIVTDEGVSYFVKVRHGISNFLVAKTADGKIIKFNADDINSYRKSGEVYQKKQLIINGKPCENCTFLRLLTTKSGFGFYMHETYNYGQAVKKFYVYSGDKYVLELNIENYLQMLSFFKIT